MKILYKRVLLMALLVFCSWGLWAMPNREKVEASESLVIKDMRGRDVSIPEEVNSVIALGAGSLRLLTYLNAVDKVIAVEDAGHGREKTEYGFYSLATYRLAYPGLRELPSIGSAENHEAIIAADPDLIICSTVDTGQLDQLQSVLGIPVFAVDVDVELGDSERFFHQLETLGSLLGRKERALSLIEGLEAALQDLNSRAAQVETPQRGYAGGMMFFGPADLLRTTGDYLPFDLTGSENVMPSHPSGNRQPYMTSLEDLAAADPDYVFIDAANIELSKAGFQKNREVLMEQVSAFADQEVYSTLVYKYYGTNWENQLINIYYVGSILYPELYEDISVQEKAEEIWELFFSVPLEYSTVTEQQKTGLGRIDWF